MSRDLVVARSDWATALAQSARNLGSNVDLAYAYASAEGPLFSAFLRRGMRIPDDRCLYNSGRRDLAHVFRSGGSVRCGNVPGTAVFFRGPDVRSGRIRLDERFGPYGAEDVDLCWRLADSGSDNVVVLSSGVLHATTGRPADRRSAGGTFVERVNDARVRALLARCRWPQDWRRRVLDQAVASLFAEALHQRGRPHQRLLAWVLGIGLASDEAHRVDGARELAGGAAAFAWPVTLTMDLLRADARRFRLARDTNAVLDDVVAASERCTTLADPSSEDVESVVAALADEARRLGARVDDEFDAVVAWLATMALSGELAQPGLDAAALRTDAAQRAAAHARRRAKDAAEASALAGAAAADERRRADEQAALVMASSVEIERLGRLITDLEARLGAQQRRLDRRVARTGLKLADSLGRTQRRIRRIRPPQF